MKRIHIFSVVFCLALLSGSVLSLRAQDMLYFHDQASIIKPTYLAQANAYPMMVINVEYELLATIQKELLEAQTAEEMDRLINELVRYQYSYGKPQVLNDMLEQVNQHIAYYGPRINHRFDYGALKKGLGLGILTGLALYGIKAIQDNYYKPASAQQEQSLADLRTMGIEHHTHHERGMYYDICTTDFTGVIPAHTLAIVQAKMQDFRMHRDNADTARGGQCVAGGAGVFAGMVGAGYIYRGLTTNCAQEFARYTILKVKLEEIQAALDASVFQAPETH